jgi:hypothetical protein
MRFSVISTCICTFVKPLLEFSSITCSCYTVIDTNHIESVLRSFKKTIKNLWFSTYKECLVNFCLECRQQMADLAFCYKQLHGVFNLNSTKFILLSSNTQSCGNQLELVEPRSASVCDAIFS